MHTRTKSVIRTARIGLPLLAVVTLAAACGSAGHTAGAATGQVPAAGAPAASITLKDGHLADGSGRTVYLWVADSAGQSTCTGACAKVWPPVPATVDGAPGSGVSASEVSTITRSDGTKQLAYAGHALYYYAADTSAGDTHGQGSDGFGAKWWELSADGQAITGSGGGVASSSAPAGGGYGY